jgi:hypothetical protein
MRRASQGRRSCERKSKVQVGTIAAINVEMRRESQGSNERKSEVDFSGSDGKFRGEA